jgi:hypothetical protein
LRLGSPEGDELGALDGVALGALEGVSLGALGGVLDAGPWLLGGALLGVLAGALDCGLGGALDCGLCGALLCGLCGALDCGLCGSWDCGACGSWLGPPAGPPGWVPPLQFGQGGCVGSAKAGPELSVSADMLIVAAIAAARTARFVDISGVLPADLAGFVAECGLACLTGRSRPSRMTS